MAKKKIPDEIRAQVETIVDQFNEKDLRGSQSFYETRYRGVYLYLDRNDWGYVCHVCRLTYNGAMDNWDFAIFKYSRGGVTPPLL